MGKNEIEDWEMDEYNSQIQPKEIKEMIRKYLPEILSDYGYKQKSIEIEPYYITTTQLAYICEVSRQIITQWRKSLSLKPLMERIVKMEGKKAFFDVNGLRKTLKESPHLITEKDKKKFRNILLSEYQRNKERYYEIGWKIRLDEHVSKDDLMFYDKNRERYENE